MGFGETMLRCRRIPGMVMRKIRVGRELRQMMTFLKKKKEEGVPQEQEAAAVSK